VEVVLREAPEDVAEPSAEESPKAALEGDRES
jgi:hypothetical protein